MEWECTLQPTPLSEKVTHRYSFENIWTLSAGNLTPFSSVCSLHCCFFKAPISWEGNIFVWRRPLIRCHVFIKLISVFGSPIFLKVDFSRFIDGELLSDFLTKVISSFFFLLIHFFVRRDCVHHCQILTRLLSRVVF